MKHVMICSILLVSAIVADSQAQLKQDEVDNIIAGIPGYEIPSDAEAAILFRSETVWLKSRLTLVKDLEVVMLLVSSQSKNIYGDVRILFDNRCETIEVLEARTYTSDQLWLPIMQGADNVISPLWLAEAPAYQFIQQRVISFSGAEPGAVLHYRIRRTIDYSEHDRFLWGSHNFQDEIPIITDKFVLRADRSVPVSYRLINRSASPQMEIQDNERLFTWVVQKSPMLHREWSMVALESLVPRVLYTTATGWREAGDWFRNKIQPQYLISPEIKALIGDLISDADEDSDKIKAMYAWVSENIRDVNLSLDLNGYTPNPVTETFKNRQGTSLDKATMLISMLRYCHIKADPVLMQSVNLKLPADFPSCEAFDKVGVRVTQSSRDHLWLDMEGINLQPGLVISSQGTMAFCVTDDDSNVQFIPLMRPEQSVSLQTMNLVLDSTGSARVNLKWKGTGYFDFLSRSVLRTMTPVEKNTYFQSIITRFDPTATNMIVQESDWKNLDQGVSIEMQFDCSHFAVLEGEVIVVPIPEFPLPFSHVMVPSDKDRVHPVKLDSAAIEQLQVILNIPVGYDIVYCPGEKDKNSPGLRIRQKSKLANNGFELNRKMLFKTSELIPDAFAKTRQVYDTFKISKQNLCLLEKTSGNKTP